MSELVFPVYEFRPDPDWLKSWARPSNPGPLHRYDGGQWREDDGEYDIAFTMLAGGAPLCLYVSLPYHRNIRWSWLTGHWSGPGPAAHPTYTRSLSPNPWHYMLRDGATDWGRAWAREQHENTVAGDKGMSWVSSQRGCANGRHVEFHLNDPHIKAGLVRERESKTVVVFPERPICMYCDARSPR